MNEEFAIRLKMIMDESSIASVKKQLAVFSKDTTDKVNVAVSPAKNVTDEFDVGNVEQYSAQIELLIAKIADLREGIRILKDDPKTPSMQILEMQAELEKYENQLSRLLNKGTQAEESVVAVAKTTVSIRQNLMGATKYVKILVGGLIGAYSIYGSIRKAMSAYLSQNQELTNKLNACWYALGSLFAPVLEWIINKFVYLVSLVNALVQALGFAGINMTKYGKATGKANKQTASFDEINNISKGGGGQENPFGNFDLSDKFKNLSALIKANAEKLKLIGLGAMFGIGVACLFTGHVGMGLGMILASGVLGYKYLSENWDYIIEKVGGITNAITLLLGGFTAGLGLVLLTTGHVGLGVALLASGLSISASVIDWSVLPNEITKVLETIAGIVAVSMFLIGFILLFSNPLLGIALMAGSVASVFGIQKISDNNVLSKYIGDNMDEATETGEEKMGVLQAKLEQGWGNISFDASDAWRIIKENLTEKINEIKENITTKVDEIKRNSKEKWEDIRSSISEKVSNIGSKVGEVFSQIGSDISTAWENAKTNSVNKWDDIKKSLEEKWENLKSWWSGLSLGGFNIKLPHLSWSEGAWGLPKFSIDWYAKGGVFTNPSIIGVGEYANASSNPEIVAPLSTLSDYMSGDDGRVEELLERLIDVVDSKDFKAYISRNEIGRTAVEYIHNQSRIMGESLV